MDFPIILTRDSNLEFVYGYEELKQTIFLLLKQGYGTFLQDAALGNRTSVHVSDADMIQLGVTRVLDQVPGVTVEGMSLVDGVLVVRITYRGDLFTFDYSISSF